MQRAFTLSFIYMLYGQFYKKHSKILVLGDRDRTMELGGKQLLMTANIPTVLTNDWVMEIPRSIKHLM